jgi:hypothetical protein
MDIVAGIVIPRSEAKSTIFERLADNRQCSELLAFSPRRAKIVGRHAYKACPAQDLHAARQGYAFGALDVHLEEIDVTDAQFGCVNRTLAPAVRFLP